MATVKLQSTPRQFRQYFLILLPFTAFMCIRFITSQWKLLPSGFLPTTWTEDQVDAEKLHLHIRKHLLRPPGKAYHFNWSEVQDPGPAIKEMHALILRILKNQTDGFFIECGAVDGLFLSNTLHLEAHYNWSGLLIEPDPKHYVRLIRHERRAWRIKACLSLNSTAYEETMTRRSKWAGLSTVFITNKEQSNPKLLFKAQCFPLVTILQAVKELPAVVDYFSLDVESAEFAVLKTIPWEQVYIKVISVEDNGKRAELIRYLEGQGYKLVKYIYGPWVHDLIFVHSKYLEENPDLKFGDPGLPTTKPIQKPNVLH